MKKIIALMMIFVMISALILPVSAADNHVVFETEGLEQIVRDALNIKTNRKLWESDMLKITEIYLDQTIILENLDDLKHFKNLESLTLADQILLDDLSGIESFENLKSFGLYNCPISDLNVLSDIKTLEAVWLLNIPVDDIKSILKQPNLKSLAVSGTDITDISALKNNRTLELFIFEGDRLENIDVLAKIKSLEILSLSGVKNIDTDDFKFLYQLKLKEIELVDMGLDNRIVNILKNMKTLTYIDLSYNNITRLTPLYELPNLETLECRTESEQDIAYYLAYINEIFVIADPYVNFENLEKFGLLLEEMPDELLCGILSIIITNDYNISYYNPDELMLVLNNFDSQNESLIHIEEKDLVFTEFEINLAKFILESYLSYCGYLEVEEMLTNEYIIELINYYEEIVSAYEGFDLLLNYIIPDGIEKYIP